ncbi:MAG: DUF3857 domain-containing transglutaminase family protein [Acidobacteria bacterium]|nr:DUF3857 domain-containing transglutaminase family protein [Acidobacteriota bacterium]
MLTETVTVTIAPDGTWQQDFRRRVRVLSAAGVEKYRQERFHYRLGQSGVELRTLKVYQPDGSVRGMDTVAVRDEPWRPGEDVPTIFEKFRRKVITISVLNVQDIVELEVHYDGRSDPCPHYADVFLFQYTDPVAEKSLEIRTPAGMPLRWAVQGGELEYSSEQAGDVVRHRWQGRQLPGLAMEALMLDAAYRSRRVVVSTFASPAELSRAAWELARGKLSPDISVDEVVRQTSAGKTELPSRIMAAYRFVSGEIEYLPGSFPIAPLQEPASAADVLDRRAGTGRDLNILLIAMLQRLGLECEEAFLTFDPSPSGQVPALAFDRAVTCVRLPDGGEIFLDPTLGLGSSFGDSYVGGRHILRLRPEGAGLESVPSQPASRSTGHIQALSRLADDGTLLTDATIQGNGHYDVMLRRMAREFPDLESAGWWLQTARTFCSVAQPGPIKMGDWRDLAIPFRQDVSFTFPNYAIGAGDYLLFHIPQADGFLDIFQSLFGALDCDREEPYPLFLEAGMTSRRTERIRLPDGAAVVALPDDVAFRRGPLELQLAARVAEGNLLFEGFFRCEGPVVAAEFYDDVCALGDAADRFAHSYVVLRRPSPTGSDR